MIWFLRIAFTLIILTMLFVTTKATMIESLFAIAPVVQNDPWFQATLWDAYFGFLTFYFWVFYKKPGTLCRITWFIVIMLTGNIGMAVFMLMLLFKLPTDASAWEILLNERDAKRMTAGSTSHV